MVFLLFRGGGVLRGLNNALHHIKADESFDPRTGENWENQIVNTSESTKSQLSVPFVMLMQLRRTVFRLLGSKFRSRSSARRSAALTSVYAGGGGSASSPPSQKEECVASLSMLMAAALRAITRGSKSKPRVLGSTTLAHCRED